MFRGQYSIDYGGLVAGALLILIPQLVFYGAAGKSFKNPTNNSVLKDIEDAASGSITDTYLFTIPGRAVDTDSAAGLLRRIPEIYCGRAHSRGGKGISASVTSNGNSFHTYNTLNIVTVSNTGFISGKVILVHKVRRNGVSDPAAWDHVQKYDNYSCVYTADLPGYYILQLLCAHEAQIQE